MGVNIRDIAISNEIEIGILHGKTIAIDALNTIYQFLSIIRDRMTGEPLKDSEGNVTSHLSGLFYRTSRILGAGITPVFVFDGKPPDFKKKVQQERRRIREEARVKWQKAVEEGDAEKVRLYSQQVSDVTSDMLEESKRLLEAMGVQCIQAPSEGEAQAAFLNRKGLVYACGSQDWDSLLFGAPRLVRNITISGKRKLPRKETYVNVNPHMIDLEKMLGSLGINQEQLVLLGILTGTDYNPGGIHGFGPKKALEMVRQHKSLREIKEKIEWKFETPIETIFDFFINPPAEESRIEKTRMDAEKVKQILVGEHRFSEERVSGILEKLDSSLESRKQSSLSSFF